MDLLTVGYYRKRALKDHVCFLLELSLFTTQNELNWESNPEPHDLKQVC